MIYFVYVLRNLKKGRLYTGSTGDIDRCVDEHNNGHSKATRTRVHLSFYI
ncbi:GIY-YIG nuclease family protein [Candidatus Saccharibacteria bacterium]|nr:GIY-YIG nuclease family protein [Candidatus Saccharibacteria bacterium]